MPVQLNPNDSCRRESDVSGITSISGGECCQSSLSSSVDSIYAAPDFHGVDSEDELYPETPDIRCHGYQDIEGSGNGPGRRNSCLIRYGGMLATFVTCICFSFVTLIVKVLSKHDVDPYTCSFWRYSGILFPTFPIFFYCYWKDPTILDTIWPIHKNKNWKSCIGLLSRGLIGSTAVILRYCALQYLSLGDMLVIVYAAPVLVTVMAHFFLGERCGFVPIIVALTTVFGLVCVTKPPLITGATTMDRDTMIGASLAFGALLCSSLIVIITRKIRKVHFTLMMIVFGVIGIGQAFLTGFVLKDDDTDVGSVIQVPSETTIVLLILALAFLSFVGQISVILALKFEQAGPVALMRSCEVLFGFLFQFMFLGVVPDIYSGIGSSIVITGVIIIAARKWVQHLEPESGIRLCLGWLLY